MTAGSLAGQVNFVSFRYFYQIFGRLATLDDTTTPWCWKTQVISSGGAQAELATLRPELWITMARERNTSNSSLGFRSPTWAGSVQAYRRRLESKRRNSNKKERSSRTERERWREEWWSQSKQLLPTKHNHALQDDDDVTIRSVLAIKCMFVRLGDWMAGWMKVWVSS